MAAKGATLTVTTVEDIALLRRGRGEWIKNRFAPALFPNPRRASSAPATRSCRPRLRVFEV
jgi:hypothetical protein